MPPKIRDETGLSRLNRTSKKQVSPAMAQIVAALSRLDRFTNGFIEK